MKYVTEIILMTLIVGCLTAMIVILTNSCKNSGFRLKKSFSTPTVLDSLAFFTTGANKTISSLITAMVKNNITANKIFVVGPLNGSYGSFKGLENISSSPTSQIQFIRLITNNDGWMYYINSLPSKTLAGKLWKDVLSGYHDIIKTQVPIKTWKYAGICCTSEGESKIACPSGKVVKSGDVILGAWNAMLKYKNNPTAELTFQMAAGSGDIDNAYAPIYSNFMNNTFGEVCTNPTRTGAKINADHWMPEYTYEPASLNEPAPSPASPGANTHGCCDKGASSKEYCDYANLQKTCKETGLICQMTKPAGWVDLVSKCGSCGSGKTTKNGQTQYITIGMPSSNADCRFIDGNDGIKYVIEAIKTLIKNGYENIALYTRG